MSHAVPIYLDYMASTPLDARVLEAMLPYWQDPYWCANPASVNHYLGQQAFRIVEESRALIAQTLRARPEEIIFTSGATESNNLAIFGAARFYQRQGKHMITLATEHKSVLNVFQSLEQQGFEVTYLTPSPSGLLDMTALTAALRSDTILVSVMQVNNEIGVIQDIATIAQIVKAHGALFHVDAAQSIGRLALDLSAVAIDLLSLSSHKVYGPKGIGALFVRQKPRVNLQPLLYGGQQEQGLRPGTLALALIVGMAKAFELAEQEREVEQKRLWALHQQLFHCISELGDIHWNGDLQQRVAANLNFIVLGLDGADLVHELYPLIVSNQSACSVALNAYSHVLQALGLPQQMLRSAVRLSIGRMTTSAEIAQTCDILQQIIPRLRAK